MDACSFEQTIAAMPNIQELRLVSAKMSGGFLQPGSDGPLANAKRLPFLRYLHLEDILMYPDYWSSLISYLAHQTSGGQAISLRITGKPVRICPHVVEEIKGLAEEFRI